jgi:hypothetical protein
VGTDDAIRILRVGYAIVGPILKLCR